MRGEESATFLVIKYKKMWQFLPLEGRGCEQKCMSIKKSWPIF